MGDPLPGVGEFRTRTGAAETAGCGSAQVHEGDLAGGRVPGTDVVADAQHPAQPRAELATARAVRARGRGATFDADVMSGSGSRTAVRPTCTAIEDDVGLAAQVQHAPDLSDLTPAGPARTRPRSAVLLC